MAVTVLLVQGGRRGVERRWRPVGYFMGSWCIGQGGEEAGDGEYVDDLHGLAVHRRKTWETYCRATPTANPDLRKRVFVDSWRCCLQR